MAATPNKQTDRLAPAISSTESEFYRVVVVRFGLGVPTSHDGHDDC